MRFTNLSPSVRSVNMLCKLSDNLQRTENDGCSTVRKPLAAMMLYLPNMHFTKITFLKYLLAKAHYLTLCHILSCNTCLILQNISGCIAAISIFCQTWLCEQSTDMLLKLWSITGNYSQDRNLEMDTERKCLGHYGRPLLELLTWMKRYNPKFKKS